MYWYYNSMSSYIPFVFVLKILKLRGRLQLATFSQVYKPYTRAEGGK